MRHPSKNGYFNQREEINSRLKIQDKQGPHKRKLEFKNQVKIDEK